MLGRPTVSSSPAPARRLGLVAILPWSTLMGELRCQPTQRLGLMVAFLLTVDYDTAAKTLVVRVENRYIAFV